ncbi:hypothetical protein EDD17DRAFT_1528932 [Pisolithus thermaeus]|nr:hypothetical protein EDD17DRAFT_1528932 [Pisolithus thermaeus]
MIDRRRFSSSILHKRADVLLHEATRQAYRIRPWTPSPFEACCAILIPVTFARVTARYILCQSDAIDVPSRPSCCILAIRCDYATEQLTGRKAATTPILASFTLANSERNGRTTTFGIASLLFICTVYTLLHTISRHAGVVILSASIFTSPPLPLQLWTRIASPPASHDSTCSLGEYCLVDRDAEKDGRAFATARTRRADARAKDKTQLSFVVGVRRCGLR